MTHTVPYLQGESRDTYSPWQTSGPHILHRAFFAGASNDVYSPICGVSHMLIGHVICFVAEGQQPVSLYSYTYKSAKFSYGPNRNYLVSICQPLYDNCLVALSRASTYSR